MTNIEIQIRQSSIWITPYYKGLVIALEKAISVYDFPSRKYTQFLYEFDIYPEDKQDPGYSNKGVLKIPRGVGIDFVKKCFDERNIINYTVVDKSNEFVAPRKVEIELRKDFIEPRDEYQKNAIEFLKKETFAQKFLSLDTGFGKTFCAINYIAWKQQPALIISKNLHEQWLGFITDYTKCQNERDIELLQGSKALEDIAFAKGFKKKHKASFYITTIDTLRSFASKHGPDALQLIADNLELGIKIFDEAHTNYLMTNEIDMNMQVEETIYLTATPGRSNQAEDRIFKKIFAHVPTHGVYTHLLKQYYFINKYTYDSCPSQKDIAKCNTRYGFNAKSYAEYLFSTNSGKAFVYGVVRDILIKLFTADPDCKALVLIELLKDIQWLHDMLERDKELSSMGITCGMYCSIVKNTEEKEKELSNPVILGTIGSLSAGHDIPGLRAIIPFTTFSSSIIARQLLGRLRYVEGKAVYYFDFMDEGFPAMSRQRKERMNIFVPRAKEIKEKFITFDEVINSIPTKFRH